MTDRALGYHEDIEALTPGVFRLSPRDLEPVPKPWRSQLVWEGETWAEIDPETGEIIATGTIGERAQSDREELRP